MVKPTAEQKLLDWIRHSWRLVRRYDSMAPASADPGPAVLAAERRLYRWALQGGPELLARAGIPRQEAERILADAEAKAAWEEELPAELKNKDRWLI